MKKLAGSVFIFYCFFPTATPFFTFVKSFSLLFFFSHCPISCIPIPRASGRGYQSTAERKESKGK